MTRTEFGHFAKTAGISGTKALSDTLVDMVVIKVYILCAAVLSF
jgi:hypothetical protein